MKPRERNKNSLKTWAQVTIVYLLSHAGISGIAQHNEFLNLSLNEAVTMAMENHPAVENARLNMEVETALKKDVLQLPPTEFNVYHGQVNSAITDYSWSITQNLGSVPEHIVQHNWQQQQIQLAGAEMEYTRAAIARDVKRAYLELAYQHEVLDIYFRQKELYSDLKRIARLRYEHGEYSELEKMTAETRQAEIENRYLSQQDEVFVYENKLRKLILTGQEIVPTTDITYLYEIAKKDSGNYRGNAYLNRYEIKQEQARLAANKSKTAFFPEIGIGYFRQQIDGVTGFSGIVASASFPLWFLSPGTQIKKNNLKYEMALNEYQHQQYQVKLTTQNLILKLNKHFRQLQYYMDHALQNARELAKTARLKFEKEEIDYVEYIQSLDLAFEIEQHYLETVRDYNQTAIELEFYAQ